MIKASAACWPAGRCWCCWYYEATALTNLGDAHHSAGNHDAARTAWQHALDILDDLDHPTAERVRVKVSEFDASATDDQLDTASAQQPARRRLPL